MAISRRGVRGVGGLAAVALSAGLLGGCTGGLPVTVTGVTGTLEPAIGVLSGGVPVEQVSFTVGGYSLGTFSLVCLVGVRYLGQLVGSTVAKIGSEAGTAVAGTVTETVAVYVNLPSPFDGVASDASVACTPGR